MVGDFSKPLHFNPQLISIHEMIDPEYEEIDAVDFVRWEEGKLIVSCLFSQLPLIFGHPSPSTSMYFALFPYFFPCEEIIREKVFFSS